jgi:predicted permease
MSLLLKKLLPVLFMILIGIVSRKRGLFSDSVMNGIKTIILKMALPAVLFTAFAKAKLEASYLILFILVFLFCALLYGLGEALHRLAPRTFGRRFSSGYFTGFEFGMLGVGLFSAIWGIENLSVIMLIGFGHELFIWFVYVPLISSKGSKDFVFLDTLRQFIKTPTILAISLGILFNLLGVYDAFGKTVLGFSLYATLDLLMPLTSPLILIIIGYSMTFKALPLPELTAYIGTRLLATLGLGSLVLLLILRLLPQLDPLFAKAFYAFALLPAPYILPLFIEDKHEAEYFSQLLVYSTLVCFTGYTILLGLTL